MATDYELGIPSNLAPLIAMMQPGAAEVSAAKDPLLLGAYSLERRANLGRATKFAQDAQNQAVQLARQKMMMQHLKDRAAHFTGEPVISRLQRPNEVQAALFPEMADILRSPTMDKNSVDLFKSMITRNLRARDGGTTNVYTREWIDPPTIPGGQASRVGVKSKTGLPPAPGAPAGPPTTAIPKLSPERQAAIVDGESKGVKFEYLPDGIKWTSPNGRSGTLPY